MPGIGSDRVLQGCGHQALLMGVSSKGDELCLNSRKRPEHSIKNRFYSLYLFIVLFILSPELYRMSWQWECALLHDRQTRSRKIDRERQRARVRHGPQRLAPKTIRNDSSSNRAHLKLLQLLNNGFNCEFINVLMH